MSDTFPSGKTVYLDAAVLNRESVDLPGTPGTWTCDQGTLTQDPANPDLASVVSIPVGVFNATFTTTDGSIVGSYQAAVVDATPASVTITGSTTPPVAASPAVAA
jgi:hypothetical protein